MSKLVSIEGGDLIQDPYGATTGFSPAGGVGEAGEEEEDMLRGEVRMRRRRRRGRAWRMAGPEM